MPMRMYDLLCRNIYVYFCSILKGAVIVNVKGGCNKKCESGVNVFSGHFREGGSFFPSDFGEWTFFSQMVKGRLCRL